MTEEIDSHLHADARKCERRGNGSPSSFQSAKPSENQIVSAEYSTGFVERLRFGCRCENLFTAEFRSNLKEQMGGEKMS